MRVDWVVVTNDPVKMWGANIPGGVLFESAHGLEFVPGLVIKEDAMGYPVVVEVGLVFSTGPAKPKPSPTAKPSDGTSTQ